MATISRLSVSLTARTRKFRKGMASAGGALKSLVGSVFNTKNAIIGLVGAAGLGFLGKSILTVNARVQTLKSSLKTMTGGTKQAAKAFKLIEKFAASTPFDLEQVVSGFIKLKSLGLDPSEEALRSYGNTASAMGKSLNDFIEAVADASTNEFERLKEFGIKAKQQGDQVAFTFQGVTTTVQKNATAIEGYLRDIGETTFGGAMKEQEGNLSTAFSNIGDAFVRLATKIGESGVNDLVVSLVNSFTAWLNAITPEEVKKIVKAVVGFGFDVARAMSNGIKWLAQFGNNIKSFELLWLGLQQTIVGFGLTTINVLANVGKAIDQFMGNTKQQQVAGLDRNIKALQDTMRGKFEQLDSLGDIKPETQAALLANIDKIREKMNLLKLERSEVLSGVGARTGIFGGVLTQAKSFLGGLQSDLAGQIASAERILQQERGGDIEDSILKGASAFDKFLDEQELIFKGEDKTKQLVGGRDPQLEAQERQLEAQLKTNELLESGFQQGAFAS